MLKALFEWWDSHPNSYWAIVVMPTLWLLVWALRPSQKHQAAEAEQQDHWLSSGLTLFVFLLAWRWPYLFSAVELNPDESQHIAGAITLLHDPVFWRSVDGVTSGPLNFYALAILRLVGMPLDYFTARLLSVLLAWSALLAIYQGAKAMLATSGARLAILPLAFFFATLRDDDFVQYSTEQIPMALTAVAIYYLVIKPEGVRAWLWGGLAAGCMPWAKLQALPIAGALIMWSLAASLVPLRRFEAVMSRRCLGLVGASLAPSALIISLAAVTGQLAELWLRYFAQNFFYVSDHSPLKTVLNELWGHSIQHAALPAYAATSALVILSVTVLRNQPRGRTSRHFLAGAILTLVAIFCILTPRRPFLHYLMLLVVPLGFWSCAALAQLWNQASGAGRRWIAIITLILGALLPIAWHVNQGAPAMFGNFSEHWRNPRGTVANIIQHYTFPGDTVGIWGWRSSAYVESNRVQATRDTVTFWAIHPSQQRERYRSVFLSDLQRSRPKIFIDAIGPGSQFFDTRSIHGHENFPALETYVGENYTQLIDLNHARIYLRNDIISEAKPNRAELQKLVIAARSQPFAVVRPTSISELNTRPEKLGREWVHLLLPPSEMMWTLEGDERALRMHYGFFPHAYREGISDGVQVIVELHRPGLPGQPIFVRLLDPTGNAGDRKPIATEITLPPFEKGSKLVVRSNAGDSNNDAWDWLYFSKLEVRRSPFYTPAQFPNFNRVPDAISARALFYVREHSATILMSHAPATMSFALSGQEKELELGYGIQSGAYENGGQTDGVTFVAVILRGDATDESGEIIFERHIDPVSDNTVRGNQRTSIQLPAIASGDRLVLHIKSGPSDSWDWTYFNALDLN